MIKKLGGINLKEIAEPSRYIEKGVLKYNFILTLGCGKMFGELGLLMKKPRAATILAKEDTEFAVLSANDFRKILEVVELKKIDDKVNFFKKFML